MMLGRGDTYAGRNVWERVYRFAEIVGGQVVRSTITRLDLTCDFIGSMEELSVLLCGWCCIKRSRKIYVIPNGSRTESVVGGNRKGVYFTVYDKEAECKVKDPIKWQAVCDRLGVDVHVSVFRIEFKVTGDIVEAVLGTKDIDAVIGRGYDERNYPYQLGDLAHWLTRKWVRLADGIDRHRRHTETARTHPLWLQVQVAFDRAFHEVREERTYTRHRAAVANPGHLWKQFAGILTTIAAIQCPGIASAGELFRLAEAEVARTADVMADVSFKRGVIDARLDDLHRFRVAKVDELDPVPFDVRPFDEFIDYAGADSCQELQ
jgi:hypothetical protein